MEPKQRLAAWATGPNKEQNHLLGRKKNNSCLRFPDRPLKNGPTQTIL